MTAVGPPGSADSTKWYFLGQKRPAAADAGLAHTAIYNHFGSKADLFTAVFVHVQDLLITELHRSVRAEPARPPFPWALLDAVESLRATDPSYVEFLALMDVEVRRAPELQLIFQSGTPFPMVETLRELAGRDRPRAAGTDDDTIWFRIAFALGLAQLSALTDAETFAATVTGFRQQFATAPFATLTSPERPPR